MDLSFSVLDLRVTDLVDILLVSALSSFGIAWLRQSRARLALLGLAIIGAVYLAARLIGLQLTAWILQGFFAVFVFVLVVVFQEDLRQLFEQIALWGLRRRASLPTPNVVDAVVRAMASLAAQRQGALLVIPGRDPLERHMEGGIPLQGQVSEPLLLSLFDPSSPGHDGAVLMEGDRLTRFAVHLPLSADERQLSRVGTRHAAALGLAERSDALCVVVSEERGTISVASGGRLRRLSSPEVLGAEIQRFLGGLAEEVETTRRPWRAVATRWREALGGLGLGLGLWALLVPGSRVTQVTEQAEVVIQNLPTGYVLEGVEPPAVDVVLSGRFRDHIFTGPGAPRVEIDAFLAKLGRRTFQIDPALVEGAGRLEVVDVTPQSVRIQVALAPGGAKNAPPATEEDGVPAPP